MATKFTLALFVVLVFSSKNAEAFCISNEGAVTLKHTIFGNKHARGV